MCEFVSGHFPSIMALAYVPQWAFVRKKTELNCSRSFHRFSRQIIWGLCPLAPTLCPSHSLWPIITCHSFDLFISSSLGWVEAKRNPLISGSWLGSLRGEFWGDGGKQQQCSAREGKQAGRPYFNPKHTTSWRETAGDAHCRNKCISVKPLTLLCCWEGHRALILQTTKHWRLEPNLWQGITFSVRIIGAFFPHYTRVLLKQFNQTKVLTTEHMLYNWEQSINTQIGEGLGQVLQIRSARV